MFKALGSAVLIISWSAGCGRVGFGPAATRGAAEDDGRPVMVAPSQSTSEAGVDAAPTESDAGLDAGAQGGRDAGGAPSAPLVRSDPFTKVRRVGGVSSDQFEDDPTLTRDLLELVFAREIDDDEDLWIARRQDPEAPFGAPAPLRALNSPARETAPWLSPDGLRLVFQSFRDGDGVRGAYYEARRADRDQPWSAPARLPAMATRAVGRLNETEDGLRRLFVAGDPDQLVEAERAEQGGPWSAGRVLDALESEAREGDPYLLPGGRVVVFYSRRTGGPGDKDLYVAARQTVDSPFEPPVLLLGVNTAASEADPWLSEDQRSLFFSRDGDLYEAHR